jgi:hypothetical protein
MPKLAERPLDISYPWVVWGYEHEPGEASAEYVRRPTGPFGSWAYADIRRIILSFIH